MKALPGRQGNPFQTKVFAFVPPGKRGQLQVLLRSERRNRLEPEVPELRGCAKKWRKPLACFPRQKAAQLLVLSPSSCLVHLTLVHLNFHYDAPRLPQKLGMITKLKIHRYVVKSPPKLRAFLKATWACVEDSVPRKGLEPASPSPVSVLCPQSP